MGAVDPTYPLYPIACILASAMLLVVLTTSFIRQSWNLGVAFLCFWLFLEHVADAACAIIWSDNAELKLYVFCDIVSHLQEITYTVKPMATLMITRRLYLIASLQSVELPSKAARRWDIAIEWTLGLIIPMLVAGPVYYVSQGARFEIVGGFGCTNTTLVSILDILVHQSWTIIPPMVSIIFYYPKVARTYYRQRKDIHSFLHSNPSVSRTNYLRILVLASIDILITLPIGIVNVALNMAGPLSVNKFYFYPGWTYIHTDWEATSAPYADIRASGITQLAQTYFSIWSSPVLAFVIFGLFGVTPEARASYWRIISTVGGWFGWRPSPRARNGQASLDDIEFGARPAQNTSGIDLEMGSRTPSFINTDVPATHPGADHALRESETDLRSVEEGLRAQVSSGNPGLQNSIEHRELVIEETSSDYIETASNERAGSARATTQGAKTESSASREVGLSGAENVGDAVGSDIQWEVKDGESIEA